MTIADAMLGTGAAIVIGTALAAGLAIALSPLTLIGPVRRLVRSPSVSLDDLALLKAFGFTRRQLLATVAWQASTSALLGLVVGIPVGIAAGRWLWILFARGIFAVAEPTVPWLQIVFVAIGALALANAAALLPGRDAARTHTSQLLNAE
jgi:ABC-type lipoprotein release transport system permease subunit